MPSKQTARQLAEHDACTLVTKHHQPYAIVNDGSGPRAVELLSTPGRIECLDVPDIRHHLLWVFPPSSPLK